MAVPASFWARMGAAVLPAWGPRRLHYLGLFHPSINVRARQVHPSRGEQMPALTHAFAIYVAGIDQTGPYEDKLFEAGCDDATIVISNGEMHLDFEREAAAFSD